MDDCIRSSFTGEMKVDGISQIFTGGPVVFFKWRNTPEMSVECVSPNVTDVFGYTSEDFQQGKIDYGEILHPEDAPRFHHCIETAIRNRLDGCTHPPYRVIHKDGSLVWLFSYMIFQLNEQNDITHYIGYVVDISKQKRTEEEIREHYHRLDILHQTIENINRSDTLEAIYRVATRGIINILDADRSAVLIFGQDQRAHFKAWENLSSDYRKAVDGHCPWNIHETDALPIHIKDVTTSSLKQELKEIILKEGIRALAFVPIVGSRRLLGKFMVYYNQPHVFSREEMQYAQVISENLSAAISRLNAIEELRQIGLKYRSIFDHVGDGIYQSTVDGKFLTVNPALVEMFGYDSAEEMLTIENTENLYWDARERNRLKQLVQEKRVLVNEEVKMKRKDGSLLYVLMNDRAVTDSTGKILYYEGTLTDISKLKKVEQSLVKQLTFSRGLNEIAQTIIREDDPRLLLDSTARMIGESLKLDRCLIYRIDLEEGEAVALCEWLNPEAPGIAPTRANYPLTQFRESSRYLTTNHSWLESHVHKPNPLLVREQSADILHEQMGIKSLLWYPFAFQSHGFYLLVFNHVQSLHHWQPEEFTFIEALTGLVGMALMKMHYVEEEKKHVRELRELAAIIEQSSESISLTDDRGVIVYVNSAFEKTSGYRREEVLGKTHNFFKSGKHDEQFYRELWETITRGETWAGVIINKKKDGSLFYENEIIFPIKDESGVIKNYCKIGRDITRERELEQQLRQSQKMESIGYLAGGIAHDFNNILTVIRGYTEMALIHVQDDDPLEEYLKQISIAGERAANLTSRILAFSRQQIANPRIIDLNPVVSRAVEMLRRLISEDIEIEVKLVPELPAIKADPVQIEQILMNLVINARDAIAESIEELPRKVINIETGRIYLEEEDSLRYPDRQPGVYIFLAVQDNGVGMDEETMHRIFDPYFTTKAVGQGTGLGLALVFGIVKQNGGFITVQSEPGKGTNFKIFFPVTLEKIREDASDSLKLDQLRGRETILLVEDDESVREFVSGALKRFGYSVIEALNSPDGLKQLETQKEQIDLVITDLIMPEMGGKELAEKAKQAVPECKILFISGYSEDLLFKEDSCRENMHFLPKPFTIFELAQKVRSIIDEQCY